jgi:hypothetical protein
VLDAALEDGQLSTEEHRERVSAATKAVTLGELQSLVSDLQIHRPPDQPPKLKMPAGVRRIRIAMPLVVVLLGAGIAFGLRRCGPSSATRLATS